MSKINYGIINNMNNKIILILGLMLSGSLLSEEKSCRVDIHSSEKLIETIEKCKSGDTIWWRRVGDRGSQTTVERLGFTMVYKYCDQEKTITVNNDFTKGICTYLGYEKPTY